MFRINLIDADVHRRARVSRELAGREMHVEIFESTLEFVASRAAPGVVFLWDEPGVAFADQIEAIRANAQTVTPVVGYAEAPAPADIVAAMRAGALDYLSWPFEQPLVDATFKRIARGDDRLLQHEFRRSRAIARLRNLSRRERDVLTLLVRGSANKDIGRKLGISPRTVEIHRANMMSKLGARSSSEAVCLGVHAGLDEASAPALMIAA